jgi:hypothetical protein
LEEQPLGRRELTGIEGLVPLVLKQSSADALQGTAVDRKTMNWMDASNGDGIGPSEGN